MLTLRRIKAGFSYGLGVAVAFAVINGLIAVFQLVAYLALTGLKGGGNI